MPAVVAASNDFSGGEGSFVRGTQFCQQSPCDLVASLAGILACQTGMNCLDHWQWQSMQHALDVGRRVLWPIENVALGAECVLYLDGGELLDITDVGHDVV